jgi:rhodanese-related sulfurtransferase
MRRISRDELRDLLDSNAVTLVEALPGVQYDAEHLPGAVNLPGDLTPDVAHQLALDVVTYCSGPSCRRSRVAADGFVRLGYTDVRIYEGGKPDWAAGGLPLHGTRATPEAA